MKRSSPRYNDPVTALPPMSTSLLKHPTLAGVFLSDIGLPAQTNARLTEQFHQARDAGEIRQTHHFHGRFENTYIPASQVPALAAILAVAHDHATRILGRHDLKSGFWFNEMGPGHRTSLHSHEESDELLSAVYYIEVPEASGNLLLHGDTGIVSIEPRAGLMVLFDPGLPHEVEVNRSDATRLSVAMNFGPAEEEDTADRD